MSDPSEMDRVNELANEKATDAYQIALAGMRWMEQRADMVDVPVLVLHLVACAVLSRARDLYREHENGVIAQLAGAGEVENMTAEEALKSANAFYDSLEEWARNNAQHTLAGAVDSSEAAVAARGAAAAKKMNGSH